MNAWKQSLLATALLMAATPAMAEDLGGKISGAFTSAYHGLKEGVLGAYEDGTQGAKDVYKDAKTSISGGNQSAPVASATPTPGGDDLVFQVQNELNAGGYVAGTPDGRYGPRTANAVRAYQGNNGLQQDGLVTMALLDHMRAHRTAMATPPTAPAGQPAPVQPVQPQPVTPPAAGYVAPAPDVPPAVAPAQPPATTPPASPGLPSLPKQG